jgi:hypothetical protein
MREPAFYQIVYALIAYNNRTWIWKKMKENVMAVHLQMLNQ